MTDTDKVDDPILQVLSDVECYELLGQRRLGRLAVNARHYPLILPVNYALDGHVVVIRTGPGTKLTAAQHANIAFEVDDIDEVHGSGWSVLVVGVAEEITDEHREDVVRRTHDTAVEPWAPGAHDHWLRLVPTRVTGRRLTPGASPPPFEDAGYL